MSTAQTVSIVTICRNAAEGLERTLRSVAAQDYPALEQVVVDGGSTDGTREVLERHRGRIARLISEPDRGISHAFNKGIAAAGGRWVLMLNAGDRLLAADALRTVLAAWDGEARIVSALTRSGSRSVPRLRVQRGPGLLLRAHLPHQGTLVQRELYARHGGYDESYRIRMDFDFFLRVLPHERLQLVERWLSELEPGGISGREFRAHWSEGRRALAHNGCGIAARLQYELLFLAMSAARVMRSSP